MRANPDPAPLYVPDQWTREFVPEVDVPRDPTAGHATATATADSLVLVTAMLFAWALVLALGIGGIVWTTATQPTAVAAVTTGTVIGLATGGSLLVSRVVLRIART